QPVIARYLRLIPLDWNPTGRIGLRLEIYGCRYTSEVAGFDGKSSLVYRLSARTSWTARESISLKFKTLRNSGTLLHAKGQRDHSLNLALERGKLLSGSGGKLLVSLGSLLDDQHWHHVKLERLGSHLNLTVDKTTQQVLVPAELSRWHIHTVRNFHGCLENLLYSELNLIKLAKQGSPQVVALGNMTFSCSEPVFVAVTFTDSHSFLQLPVLTSWQSGVVSIALQFRTWNKAGLLLTFDLQQQEGSVFLDVTCCCFCVCVCSGAGLNDGQWHSVELNSMENRLSVTVDRDEGATAHTSIPLPPAADSQLFFGGCPAHGGGLSCRNPIQGFQGCMRLLKLDGQTVDLIKVQERRLGNYSDLKIDMCGIIDRCSPSHCEHGGRCTQSWRNFHCNCSNSGYRGATCHSSKYEPSCEVYKHQGDTSGHFYVDVDGSGPIKPQLVYCNMTELTPVQASADTNQHFASFLYPSEEKQLSAVISQSEHCEQELSYHCRKSRLSNSLDGTPFSWWVGGPASGQIHNFWGEALPGSRQCACGLQDNCLDSSFYCNCDADYDLWTEDSDLLTQKESLPVRSLVLGDIHRPGSEAAYRVGPLRCHGDKNFWNAAFFDKETSYLHFPTFHGELNADISFLFKTTSSSGLFLENLGIKDFIRIELSSSTEVVFSFDVGNGPLEVKVHSDLPLNDDRWHSVRAERNVKEASLRVDGLPAALQEAPTDGFIHLQLNSQLFIEVSGSFEPTTSITYIVKEPYEESKNSSSLHSSIYSDITLRGDDVSLSFRTSQSPAPLLYVSSFYRQYLILLINKHDELEVRYKLHSNRDEEVLSSRVMNLADGRLHSVTVRRQADTVAVQNKLMFLYFNAVICFCSESEGLSADLAGLASAGFSGCLSAVRFGAICPLKAALLRPDGRVSVAGAVVASSCAAPAQADSYAAETTHSLSGKIRTTADVTVLMPLCVLRFSGVIAVVIFIVVCAAAILARFICLRKETYRNQEVKAAQPGEGRAFPFSGQPDSLSVQSENQKEFFI
uniref:Contactin-associated protein-like 4 n=1 Tax=Poecilia latipinna TaxID=48699 RepID=A0A3B3UN47_9TELE